MLDEVTATKDLRKLRRYVLWSLLPFPVVLAAVQLSFYLSEYGTSPIGWVLIGCVLLVAWAAFVLTYLSVDRDDGITRREWALAGVGLAGLIAGAIVERLDPSTGEGPPAPTMAALLMACLLLNLAHSGLLRPTLLATAAATPVAVAVGLFVSPVWYVFPPSIVLFTFAMWSLWWIYGVSLRLDRARRMSAELAVAQERLRFASELHDIQGHHLQVIALKSELAARLGESDPVTATAEMREVERLAREALTDTRAVVSGYRNVRLRTELANAVRVLNAAGIDARHGSDGERIEIVDRGAERLMGLAVREATTNMIRHASPTRARWELDSADGWVRLTVRNDGVDKGASKSNGQGPDEAASPGAGHARDEAREHAEERGLSVLHARFAEADGQLSWRQDGNEFIVTARLPVAVIAEPSGQVQEASA